MNSHLEILGVPDVGNVIPQKKLATILSGQVASGGHVTVSLPDSRILSAPAKLMFFSRDDS